MQRIGFALSGMLGASSLLLVDSAVKGTALLGLAACVVLLLKHDSAATRHLVWMLALVALLFVPVLSVALPEWRVLPPWAGFSQPETPTDINPPHVVPPAASAPHFSQGPQWPEPAGVEPALHTPIMAIDPPDFERAALPPTPSMPELVPATLAETGRWYDLLPFIWAAGCGVLLVRLLAARVLLWNTERLGTEIWSSKRRTEASQDPLVLAFEAVSAQLGINRPVTLLIHPDKTIPVVWGILRIRLLLPAEARDWSREQLRSVLLHELAHVKRRDTLSQLLAQLACALYWFNPLVWYAAWRLGVERERACDDLVLASGVRPSAYAKHLLAAVTGLSPARWTHSCGLAMARKSSIEGRLVAVLSQNRNRRGVSVSLGALALIIAAGVSVPLAMLGAAEETPDPTAVPRTSETDSDDPQTPAPNVPNPQQPRGAAMLPPGIEENLQWGEPTNGLRAALVRPQALGEPAAGEIFDFRFVVQNVSESPIRLSTASVAPTRRALKLRQGGSTLAAFNEAQPTLADHLLQPREVAILRLFSQITEGDSITSSDPAMTFAAEFNIENAPEGSWTGKLVAAEMHAATVGYGLLPKNRSAQELFNVWNAGARRNEMIPGALIGLLAESVKQFTEYNPTWITTPQLLQMLPRLDASRDWAGQEAIALLEELAALQDTPILMALERETERTLHRGTPLPPELKDAPWGKTHAGGLRLAWLLEPRATEHHLNTRLKSRILIHNDSNSSVVFRTQTFHQVGHTATDANGAKVKTESTYCSTLGRFLPYRLAPGEFIELYAPGIGVGADQNYDDWQNTLVGTWIDAKAGDEITLTTAAIPCYDGIEKPQAEDDSRWWLDLIRARLSRYEPLPDDAEERKLLLYRVAMVLFGTPVSTEINDSFVNDREPTALDSLAERLHDRPGTTPFTGSLVSGPTTFRVLPVDSDAAKRPRTVHNPGWYTLGEKITLSVTRRPVGERIVNEASIRFFSDDPAQPAPGEPYELKLPDGYNTWAAAWMRGGTVLWVRNQNGLRSYDFSDPKAVRETQIDAENATTVPEPIRDALNNMRIESAAPPRTQPPATTRPAPTEDGAAATADDALWNTKVPFRDIPVTIANWSEPKNGLRIGLRAVAADGWQIGSKVQIELWLHNSSTRDVSFYANPERADVGLSVIVKDSEGQDHFAEPGNVTIIAVPNHCTLPAGYVANVKHFALSFDAPDNEERAWFAPKFRTLEPGQYKLRCIWSDAHPSVSGPDDWTGSLTTSELEFTLAAYVAPEPAYSKPFPATDTPK